MQRFNPDIKSYLDFDRRITNLSKEALTKGGSERETGGAKTLFDALTDPKIPAHERTFQRLKDESAVILFAGLDTTARFLTVMVCYMVSFPEVLDKLRTELGVMGGGQASKFIWSQLETLPYLVRGSPKMVAGSIHFTNLILQMAFINESLRCRCYMTSRIPRVPLEPLAYGDWVILAGVRR